MNFKITLLLCILFALFNYNEADNNTYTYSEESTLGLLQDIILPQVCIDIGVEYCYTVIIIVIIIAICILCCILKCLCC